MLDSHQQPAFSNYITPFFRWEDGYQQPTQEKYDYIKCYATKWALELEIYKLKSFDKLAEWSGNIKETNI